jgi:hypothetical protein
MNTPDNKPRTHFLILVANMKIHIIIPRVINDQFKSSIKISDLNAKLWHVTLITYLNNCFFGKIEK